jgi:hypothetical protein
MQRDPYVLEEEADSSRKDAIDPYGTNTHTLWRVHGWRMSLYSLARARGMHGRHYMFTRISSNVDLGACLAPRGSVKATVGRVCSPHSHAIRLGVGGQVGVLSLVWPGRAVAPLQLLQVPSPCPGVPRVGV